MVAEVVEIETAGWGPEGATPEAVSAGATCGAILSLEAIFISCDLTSRDCFPETNSLRLGIKD
jgi:hypothetical protein